MLPCLPPFFHPSPYPLSLPPSPHKKTQRRRVAWLPNKLRLFNGALIQSFNCLLDERQSDMRWRARQLIFHLLVHNSQGWARQKPGSRNSILFSHLGSKDPSAWAATFVAFPRSQLGNGIRSTARKTQAAIPIWDASVPCRGSACCVTMPTLRLYPLICSKALVMLLLKAYNVLFSLNAFSLLLPSLQGNLLIYNVRKLGKEAKSTGI